MTKTLFCDDKILGYKNWWIEVRILAVLVGLGYQHFPLGQRNRSRYYKSRSAATYNPLSFNLFCLNENNFRNLWLLDNLYLEREQNKNL